MGLKEALEAHEQRGGKRPRCRVCHLLDTLPADEAAALTAFFDPARNVGPKVIADALYDEGHGDLYHSVKTHYYLCARRA